MTPKVKWIHSLTLVATGSVVSEDCSRERERADERDGRPG